ncbi:uncharacterized protein LOC143287505 [Babylonia areolata]|uniref:uncharacterized protein LOC143287505 n=1 Tax=Babylonia areolata TaxID=304850 RepID=UPI003FD54634
MHSDRVSTTGSEGRKSSKPIMEKRRRARINASLAELKSLLLEVIKKEGARHSKMEKADILEMAVKHLRQVQRQQYTSSGGPDPTLSDKYRLGFNECAQEVSRYLGAAAEDEDAELRARLLNHLANCITNSDSPSPLSTPSSSPAPPLGLVSSSSGSGGGGGVVTPLTPIPVRPVSGSKAGGGMGVSAGLSLVVAAQGDSPSSSSSAAVVGGSSSPPGPAAAAAVLLPAEINNNNVGLANNNHSSSSNNNHHVLGSMVLGGGGGIGGNPQMLLSPLSPDTSSTSSPPSSSSSPPVSGRRMMGEVQVVGAPKAAGMGGGGGGEVALVLPANVVTGGPVPSYIIPLYASTHALSAAGLSLTPTPTSLPATTTTPQQTPAGTLPLPLPLPLMTAPHHHNHHHHNVSVPGSTPSLVTLTPGTAALSPATVLPPASVGHVIATGLTGAPLTWQAATTTLYPASSPSFLSSSSTTTLAHLPSSSSSPATHTRLPLSLAASTGGDVTLGDGKVTSSVSPLSLVSQSAVVPVPVPMISVPASAAVAADSTEAGADSNGSGGGRLSLLHSQLLRPQGPSGQLPAPDGCVWRPW